MNPSIIDHNLITIDNVSFSYDNNNIDLFQNLSLGISPDERICIVGPNGVGKSTLTNSLQPGLELKTSHISEANKQGKHTTTFAEMHSLGFGGYIIDTTGVRGFGLVDLEDVEISHLFPELFKFQSECKFSDCKHL